MRGQAPALKKVRVPSSGLLHDLSAEVQKGADARKTIAPPLYRRLLVKKRYVRRQVGYISSGMHQNSPFWAQKSKKMVRVGSPLPTFHFPSTPLYSRLRRSTRLAPSALTLGASAPDASIRPLATLSGSTPGSTVGWTSARNNQRTSVGRFVFR